MFLSLKQKIILVIVTFFIVCFSTFAYTLYNLYDSKLQENQILINFKNQRYNELLYRYNKLKSEINSRPQEINTDDSFYATKKWNKQDEDQSKIGRASCRERV